MDIDPIYINSEIFSCITWKDGRMDINYANGIIDRGYMDGNKFNILKEKMGNDLSDKNIMDIFVPLANNKNIPKQGIH